MDELIERLRDRAADPRRRTDAPQSISVRGPGGTLSTQFGDLGTGTGAGLTGSLNLADLVSDLRRVVDANQAGRPIDSDVAGRVDSMAAALTTENSTALPPPAERATLERAERQLGRALPADLARLYSEVADGGFGPGAGLMSVERSVAVHHELVADPPGPRGQTWPGDLLPLCDREPGYLCLDLRTGRIVDWDPEELTETSGDGAWQRTFSEVADSLDAWLTDWVGARPQHEILQERVNSSLVEEARKARARIAAMTSDERAAMGLPEEGWERVVWGGIGLEDDEPGAG